MTKVRIKFLGILAVAGLCILTLSSSGCEPLRKKFIREKKKDQQAKFQPVLDPVEYEPVVHSAEEHYSQQYSMWKVWQRDYVYVMSNKTTEKRQKYTLSQVIARLEEMKKWVVQEKQTKIDGYIAKLQNISAEYEKPEALRSDYSMRRNFESITKDIQREFKPQVMANSFIK